MKIKLANWRDAQSFAAAAAAVAILHNRLLALKKFKDGITKGQILHPGPYLAAEERWAVRRYPDDGAGYEGAAHPAVAKTLTAFLKEIVAAAPNQVPFRSLITLFKDEIEILKKRHYNEDEIRRLLKLDVLTLALVGATVQLEDST